MNEQWKQIPGFHEYSVSDTGRIRSEKSGRILSLSENQFGVLCVGLMKNGEQKHRSVPLLVASAFLPSVNDAFDTPINLDGNRHNNDITNLAWRPRWFAVKYNRQFREPYLYPVLQKIINVSTGEIFKNSFHCAMTHGLLEEDVVLSIANNTVVWPTYQEFRIYD